MVFNILKGNKMAVVRDFLNPLGRDSLVRLCQLRGLRPVRSNDERRSLLAYSYRGNVADLLSDMYKYELAESLRSLVVAAGGRDFFLSRPEQYDLEKLRHLVLQAVQGRVGEEWSSLSDEVDSEQDDYQEDDEGDGDYDNDIDNDNDNDNDNDDGSAAWNDLVEGVVDVWSRPRRVSRLLRLGGFGVYKRLRTSRFRELLQRLHDSGIEAKLVDADVALVPDSAKTPGLRAKLRLRSITQSESTSSAEGEILSVREKGITTEALASRLGKMTTELCIASAYYDTEWIKNLVDSFDKKQINSIKLIYNGLGGRRLKAQQDELRALVGELGNRAEVKLAFAPGIFHAKLFVSCTTALIGSANATNAAFTVNEEILCPIDRGMAMSYFNSVWEGAVKIDSDELDDRSAARSVIGFFRMGSLFFKPQAQISYSHNPYIEWFNGCTQEERKKLSGGFNSKYAEPGQGIGAFSFYRVAGLSELNSGGRSSRKKFSIKPYAVETTLGYWVPDFYVEEVESRIKMRGEQRRVELQGQAKLLKALGEGEILNRFNSYRDDADQFIRINGMVPPPRERDQGNKRPSVLRFYDSVLRRLENDDFLDRLCNPLVRSGMPEIWDDEIVLDEFIQSFFDYIYFERTKHVPKQIAKRFGDDLDGAEVSVISQSLNGLLRKKPWKRDDWRPTKHAVSGAGSDGELP